jgi:ribonucleoside-diphosphate reductase alpha chain
MISTNKILQVVKRDGNLVDFDVKPIMDAVFKATESVGKPDADITSKTTSKVLEMLNQTFPEGTAPTVEDIQDVVEQVLIDENLPKLAKAYILFREERQQSRLQKEAILGQIDMSKLSPNAVLIAKRRYLQKDRVNKTLESPDQMFERVAKAVAGPEKKYNKENANATERKFYNMIANLDFVPAGRVLAAAGTDESQLLSSFVVAIGDSTKEIFKALYDSSIIKRFGGGVGFSFSSIRKKGTPLPKTDALASGPVSFMHLYDHASSLISSAGSRKGANMGSLSVEHPDIIDFITSKTSNTLPNFNFSVEITDNFMKAVLKNAEYDLIDPVSKKPVEKVGAKTVFDLLITMAWKYGDPGILFIDQINKANPTPKLGRFETTDPCGDQPLFPYAGVCYGAINLVNFVEKKELNWDKLKEIIPLSVRFLDNVLDISKFPIKTFKKTTLSLRNIGLGIMGFADLLYALHIPYDSREAEKLADKIMEFIQNHAHNASVKLAEERGNFPEWEKSVYAKKQTPMRNASVTTISPCGARSIIADTSGGIEPNFALGYYRRTDAVGEILQVNRVFQEVAKQRGFYSKDLMRSITSTGSIQNMKDLPEDIRKVYVTALDVSPEWHIRIQAAFQKHVDAGISKTINFPFNASINDVENACLLAYKLGCKGLTMYRDGSRSDQIITTK